jgi:hypothetical protein
MPASPRRIAYFITPHGYGHAARAAAVMASLREQKLDLFFEIFTRVPVWFFQTSIPGAFQYHDTLTDIGLAQSTSMLEDLPETVRRLQEFLPFSPERVDPLARQVVELGCEMVICDIAPLGIAVAQAAGLPSILVENFTWDWIYEGYLSEEPRLSAPVDYLKKVFATAREHIRTLPACTHELPVSLVTGVVSRKPRLSREETRERLGISQEARLVMVTMGGILTEYPFLSQIENSPGCLFLIPGGSQAYERRGSLVLIPHHSDFYHPDLVEASDMVVGKLGYSTLAEAYTAGIPYAYIPRERFRESGPLGEFARESMGGLEIPEDRFFGGEWLDVVPGLLEKPRRKPGGLNGADEIAQYLLR